MSESISTHISMFLVFSKLPLWLYLALWFSCTRGTWRNTRWSSTQYRGAAHLWWRRACPPRSVCTGSTWNSPHASGGPCRTDPSRTSEGYIRLGQAGQFQHIQLCTIYPGVTANGLLAVLTGVGVQALITLHTVGILLSQNILFPKQGLLAIVAVITLSHFDLDGTTW